MIYRHILGAMSFCLIVLIMASHASAYNPTLSGLSGVWVKVQISPSLVKGGLAINQIRADIESQLQENGIRVLSENESSSMVGRPKLHLQVNGTKVQENWKFFTFSANLYLIQDVYLVRIGATKSYVAPTWYRNIAAHGYLGDIQTRIKAVVNAFIEDYKAANP